MGVMWNSGYVKIGAVKWRISMKSYSHLEHASTLLFKCLSVSECVCWCEYVQMYVSSECIKCHIGNYYRRRLPMNCAFVIHNCLEQTIRRKLHRRWHWQWHCKQLAQMGITICQHINMYMSLHMYMCVCKHEWEHLWAGECLSNGDTGVVVAP